MSTLLDTQPTLTDLRELVELVDHYPVRVEELLELARRHNFPPEIIKFYASFAPGHIFADRDELVAETEQIEVLEHEMVDEPAEAPVDEP